jgi:hypothetical protein
MERAMMMNAYDYYSKIVRAPGAPRRPMRDPRTARPAKGRQITLSRHEYTYQPVLPMNRLEVELAKAERRAVARRITRESGWTETPPQPKTRRGIAAAYEAAERRRYEDHAIGVARRLHLR